MLYTGVGRPLDGTRVIAFALLMWCLTLTSASCLDVTVEALLDPMTATSSSTILAVVELKPIPIKLPLTMMSVPSKIVLAEDGSCVLN